MLATSTRVTTLSVLQVAPLLLRPSSIFERIAQMEVAQKGNLNYLKLSQKTETQSYPQGITRESSLNSTLFFFSSSFCGRVIRTAAQKNLSESLKGTIFITWSE